MRPKSWQSSLAKPLRIECHRDSHQPECRRLLGALQRSSLSWWKYLQTVRELLIHRGIRPLPIHSYLFSRGIGFLREKLLSGRSGFRLLGSIIQFLHDHFLLPKLNHWRRVASHWGTNRRRNLPEDGPAGNPRLAMIHLHCKSTILSRQYINLSRSSGALGKSVGAYSFWRFCHIQKSLDYWQRQTRSPITRFACAAWRPNFSGAATPAASGAKSVTETLKSYAAAMR
jgi:hypothetical protein